MTIQSLKISESSFTRLQELIQKFVVSYGDENGGYYTTNGDPKTGYANYIFDFRKAFLNADSSVFFAEMFWDTFESRFPFQIATIELWSVPFIGALLSEGKKRGKNLNALIVRKSRKKSGLANIIEGTPNDAPIILFDDIINSGSTIFQSLEILKENGFLVSEIVSILSFKSSNFSQKLLSLYPEIPCSYFIASSDISIRQVLSSALVDTIEIHPPQAFILAMPDPNKVLVVPKSNPLIDENAIYAAGEGGKVFCLDRKTLSLQWDFQTGATRNNQKNLLSSPCDIGDAIVFWAYDGSLYCLDKKTGERRFESSIAEWIGSSPTFSKKLGYIYVGVENYGESKWGVAAINISSWEVVWEQRLGQYTHGSPLYIEELNSVVCGSNCGNFSCFDAVTGDRKWRVHVNAPIKGWVAYLPGIQAVVFGSHDYSIYCVSMETGEILWSYKTEHIIYSTPLVVDNEIFVGSVDRNFYHLDAEGNVLFQYKTGGRIFWSPAEYWDFVIFGSNDMKIYFYNRKIKSMLMYIQHGERVTTKPAIFGTDMYITDFMNRVYAFDLTGI